MTRKPLLLASVAVGALLTLSACDSPADTGETATTAPVAATTTDPVMYEEAQSVTATETTTAVSTLDAGDPGDFLNHSATVDMTIRDAFAEEGVSFPAGLGLEYAQIICQGLDDGLDPEEAAMAGLYGFPQYDYMDHLYMTGVSIAAVCPEYM